MELNEFIKKFAETIDVYDVSAVTADTEFKELDEWTSLTALEIIAMVDSECGVTITGRDIRNATTVQDVYDLVESKQA